MADLPLTPGTLPSPFTCWQTLYEEMFELGFAQGPNVTGLLIQDAVPDPTDHDKGWIPTSGGVPRYPGYVFIWNVALGHWMSRHPVAPSDPSPKMYIGTLADLPTYDNGDANPAGPASGPMWEQWTPITGRVPIGVGVIPTSSPAATVAAPLDTSDSLGNSGSYQVSLTPDQIQHMHGCAQDPNILDPPATDDPAAQLHRVWDSSPETYISSGNDMNVTAAGYVDGPAISNGIFGTTKALEDPDFPVVDGHNNMQPYIGVYWIIRTARIWIVAA